MDVDARVPAHKDLPTGLNRFFAIRYFFEETAVLPRTMRHENDVAA